MKRTRLTLCEELNSVVEQKQTILNGLTKNPDQERVLSWIFDTMRSILLMIKIKNIDCAILTDEYFNKERFDHDGFLQNQNYTWRIIAMINKNQSYFDSSNLINTNFVQSKGYQFFFLALVILCLCLLFVIVMGVIMIKKKCQNHRQHKSTSDGGNHQMADQFDDINFHNNPIYNIEKKLKDDIDYCSAVDIEQNNNDSYVMSTV